MAIGLLLALTAGSAQEACSNAVICAKAMQQHDACHATASALVLLVLSMHLHGHPCNSHACCIRGWPRGWLGKGTGLPW